MALFYAHWWAKGHLLSTTYEQSGLDWLLPVAAMFGSAALGYFIGGQVGQRFRAERAELTSSLTSICFLSMAMGAISLINNSVTSRADEQHRRREDIQKVQLILGDRLGAAGFVQVDCRSALGAFPLNTGSICYGSQREQEFPPVKTLFGRFAEASAWNWQASPYSDDYRYGEGVLHLKLATLRGEGFQTFYGYRDPERWIGGEVKTRSPTASAMGENVAERESWLRWTPYHQYLILTPLDEDWAALE